MSIAERWLADLRHHGDAVKAQSMARYHKTEREVLGVGNDYLEGLAKAARQDLAIGPRLDAAEMLWTTGVFEARILAAKLLNQARIRPDDSTTWHLIQRFVPEFDGWAIADAVSISGSKRLLADPDRLGEMTPWLERDHLWSRRATLVMTLPFARLRHPSAQQAEAVQTALGWAARLVTAQTWFEQKAVAWWLRDLSCKHPDLTRDFLAKHSHHMAAFARREATKYLTDHAEPGNVA